MTIRTPVEGIPRRRALRRPGLAASGDLRPSTRVLPSQAREHNRAVLLGILFHQGALSRADLARASGLTRVTVSDLVGELIEEGWVSDLGQRPDARVGKPPTLVGLRAAEHEIVAVDLSNRSARGAVLDMKGRVAHQVALDLRSVRGQAALDVLTAFCRELLAAADHPVLGVGVGSPGVIDAGGLVVRAPNLGWTQVELSDQLQRALGVPVHVTNDANAAALAEFTYAGASPDGLLVLTVGEGVGAGLVLGGSLVIGSRQAAGEIGHLTVDPAGPVCGCGRRGCLEVYLSVPHLTAAVTGKCGADRQAALAAAGRRLGAVLAPVVAALDLEEVLLSGPAELLGGELLSTARSIVGQSCMPTGDRGPQLRMAALGESVVLKGAAALVLSSELGFS